MALSRQAKEAVVSELNDLFADTKITVVAQYSGTSVQAMQQLRAQAEDTETTIKVVKNRLVRVAMEQTDATKDADTSHLEGQLMYAFNANDEVAPAQTLHNFAKDHPSIEFVGAYAADGSWMDAEQVKQLAQLPSMEELRAQLVGTIAAPISGFVNVMQGNVRGLVQVLQARAQEMEG